MNSTAKDQVDKLLPTHFLPLANLDVHAEPEAVNRTHTTRDVYTDLTD